MDLPDCEKCSRENMTTIFNMTREVERNQTLIMDRLVYSDLIKVFLCIGRVIVVNTGVRFFGFDIGTFL